MTPSLAQNIFMPAYITLLFRIINIVKFCVRCKIIANNSSVKSTDFIKWRESLDHVYRIV